MSDKHTSDRPWSQATHSSPGRGEFSVYDAAGGVAGWLLGFSADDRALIIAAVNSHDGLLARVEAQEATLDAAGISRDATRLIELQLAAIKRLERERNAALAEGSRLMREVDDLKAQQEALIARMEPQRKAAFQAEEAIYGASELLAQAINYGERIPGVRQWRETTGPAALATLHDALRGGE